MVNIDKLNATIENLDIKAKEIEGIVNIQKKIEKIVNKVEEINVRLNTEKSNINEITKEVDKINKKSKEVIHSVENLLGEKFQDYDNIIKNNNNKILNLEKEIKIIASDFNETKNTVSNLIDNFTEVENNIKDLNKCLIKEVSEIKLENYKIINEFQGILESKVALLKSDLVLEARNNNESLNLELNSLDSKLKNLEGKLSIAEDKLNNLTLCCIYNFLKILLNLILLL